MEGLESAIVRRLLALYTGEPAERILGEGQG
jgi:hypothetical protein